jgi:hypothetical protein
VTARLIKRAIFLAIIIAIIISFRIFDLEQYLTLSYVKASQEKLAALYNDNLYSHNLVVTPRRHGIDACRRRPVRTY